MVIVIKMPGKGFKSIGIREKLFEKLEEEKREGESISDLIERLLEVGKGMVKRDGKELVTGGVGNELVNGLGNKLVIEDIKKALNEVLDQREGKQKKEVKPKEVKEKKIEIEEEAKDKYSAFKPAPAPVPKPKLPVRPL